MNKLSERILNRYFILNYLFEKKRKHILFRIYQIKSHIQSSNWNQLDFDEKIEQLIDINDTLFEQIVKEKYG
jgi:hypothetical protein